MIVTPMLRPTRPSALLILLLSGLVAHLPGAVSAAVTEPPVRLRRPIALAFSHDGSRLFVANERSGSLSEVDPVAGGLIREHDLGRSLCDVAALPGGKHLLALDQGASRLLLLAIRKDKLQVVARRNVSHDPVSLAVAADGRACVVASRWSRCLTFVGVDADSDVAGAKLIERGTLPLPFSPRLMTLVHDESRLVVADAFGGGLALVDVRRQVVESVRNLRAHNIRGLCLAPDGKSLLLAHQVLNAPARTVQDDVQWGVLLNNHVRSLDLASLTSAAHPPAIDQAQQGTRGELGRGSGDPAAIACVPGAGGAVVVALAGVDQIALGVDPLQLHGRVAVGRRPTAVAISPDGRLAAVAETLDDSVSILDIRTGSRVVQVALGPAPEATLADRGERLFFDARLSRGGWMSCHSCHTDGHSSGLNVDTFGDHQFDAPKRIPSLLGTADTGPWGWKGVFPRLEDQVQESALTTMHGPFPTDDEVAELAAYVRSLPPPRPSSSTPRDGSAIERGSALFAARCARCHAPPGFTSRDRYDVGLVDEAGEREFNPPSLRGVGLRTPLLHDGRAATLEDVLGKFAHPLGREKSPSELADLVAYLKTL